MYVYVRFADTAIVQDTAQPANFLHMIPLAAAVPVAALNPDTTQPRLTSFEIDLTKQLVYLNFDKSMNASTNLPGLYTFMDKTNNQQTASISLSTSSTSLDLSYGHQVVISISNKDMDRIMLISPILCTAITNCYLAITNLAVNDISTLENVLVPIPTRIAVAPSKFVAGHNSPNVLTFDLNMQQGK